MDMSATTELTVKDDGSVTTVIALSGEDSSGVDVLFAVNEDGSVNVKLAVNGGGGQDSAGGAVNVSIGANEDGTCTVKINFVADSATQSSEQAEDDEEELDELPTVVRKTRAKTEFKPVDKSVYGASEEDLVVPANVLNAMNFGMQCLVAVRPEHPASYLALVMKLYQEREDEIEEMKEVIYKYQAMAALNKDQRKGAISKKALFAICKELEFQPWMVMKILNVDKADSILVDETLMCLVALTDENRIIPYSFARGNAESSLGSRPSTKQSRMRPRLPVGQLESIWSKYDVNKNNLLDIEELSQLCVDLKMDCNSWQLYKKLDKNYDSVVSKDEFMTYFTK